MKPGNNLTKKTVYIDADDEITTVIEKVLGCKEQVIALVVPRRASVFGSIVNMKLLKRSADQNDKRIVLITSSSSILPLAGVVGIHVANNLTSKPYVPAKLDSKPAKPITDDKALEIDNLPKDNENITENEAPKTEDQIDDNDNTLVVDNSVSEPVKNEKKVKKSKNKSSQKMKVPNFNKFRLGLVLVSIIGLGLIGFLIWAVKYAPRAVVTINSSTSVKSLAFNIKADTSSESVDLEKSVIPAVSKDIKRTETEKVPATGTKDMGQKASGSTTLSLKDCSQTQVTVPAGTALSANGLNFITQIEVTLQSVRIGPICRNSDFTEVSTAKVKVVAQAAGDKYNVGSQKYTVSGFSNVSAQGTSMTGGVSKIVKVVTVDDISNAKQKIIDRQNAVSDELKAALTAQGLVAIKDTYTVTNDEFSPTPVADTESDEVVVTVNSQYSMLGINRQDLRKIVDNQAYNSGVDKSKQSILKDGIDDAVFAIGAKTGTITNMAVSLNIEAGPSLDQNVLKNEIKGKKSGQAQKILQSRPDIKSVTIKTSPFWNSKVPSDNKKIDLIIQGSATKDESAQKP